VCIPCNASNGVLFRSTMASATKHSRLSPSAPSPPPISHWYRNAWGYTSWPICQFLSVREIYDYQQLDKSTSRSVNGYDIVPTSLEQKYRNDKDEHEWYYAEVICKSLPGVWDLLIARDFAGVADIFIDQPGIVPFRVRTTERISSITFTRTEPIRPARSSERYYLKLYQLRKIVDGNSHVALQATGSRGYYQIGLEYMRWKVGTATARKPAVDLGTLALATVHRLLIIYGSGGNYTKTGLELDVLRDNEEDVRLLVRARIEHDREREQALQDNEVACGMMSVYDSKELTVRRNAVHDGRLLEPMFSSICKEMIHTTVHKCIEGLRESSYMITKHYGDPIPASQMKFSNIPALWVPTSPHSYITKKGDVLHLFKRYTT
jgi:hypothetical protein